MQMRIYPDKQEMSSAAAQAGAELIQRAIATRGEANVVVATGASQLDMLAILAAADIDWQRVTGFHLDEYLGLQFSHPGSFRAYLWSRFVSRLPIPMRTFHFLNGEGDAEAECRRVGALLNEHPIDVAFVGIGENGHLAFNDPPADFDTDQPFLCVTLDEACRRQQFGEGWFQSLEEVPTHAITMSIRQIMNSKRIVCTVPDERKAVAVRNAVEGPVTPDVPASILQRHPAVTLYLDEPAATLLTRR